MKWFQFPEKNDPKLPPRIPRSSASQPWLRTYWRRFRWCEAAGAILWRFYWIALVKTKQFMVLEVKEAHWLLHVLHQIDVCFPFFFRLSSVQADSHLPLVGLRWEDTSRVSVKLSEKHVQATSIWSRAIAPNLGSLRSTHSRVWVSRTTLVLSRDGPPAVQWHHHGLITVDEAQKENRYVHPNRVSTRRQASRWP